MHHYTIFIYIYMFIFYHILLFLSSHSKLHHRHITSHYHHHRHHRQLRHTKHNQMVTLDIENCQHHPKFSTRSRLTHTRTLYPTHTHNKPYIIASSIRCSCNLCIILFINHFEYFFSFLVLFPVCEPFLKI